MRSSAICRRDGEWHWWGDGRGGNAGEVRDGAYAKRARSEWIGINRAAKKHGCRER